MKKCILCGKSDFSTLMEFNNAPKNIQGLLSKKDFDKDNLISFNLVKCSSCNMVQLDDFDKIADDYYEDYIMTTSFSKHTQEYENELIDLFISEFSLKGKKIFEIGCGDGHFLELLRKNGATVVGVEPSKRFYQIAKNRDLDVRNEYFNDKTSLKQASFDAFVSRAVFEHLKNPHEILRNVKRVLKEGGVGLIEVPSFEKAIKHNRYYDIFSDHVAYYTKETLIKLLEKHNFEIIKIFNTFNDEFIVAFFRKNYNYNLEKFIKEFVSYKTEFKKKIQEFKSKKQSVVVWGAGGKGNAILSLCDVKADDIKYVVDSDKNKIGKYTIGHHFEIKKPNALLEDKVDVVIISAMAFVDEIKRKLTRDLKFKGEIYVISPKLRKIS